MRPTVSRQSVRTRRVFPEDDRAIVWFLRNRFLLVQALVHEQEREPHTRQEASARLDHAVRHATRLLAARLTVTVLLALGIIASVASAAFAFVDLPFFAEHLTQAERLFQRAAAAAGSLTAIFLILRLTLDRLIQRYDVVAAFLAARAAPWVDSRA